MDISIHTKFSDSIEILRLFCNFEWFTYEFGQTVWIPDIDMLYLLNASGLKPGGSSTVYIYTQTIHRTT